MMSILTVVVACNEPILNFMFWFLKVVVSLEPANISEISEEHSFMFFMNFHMRK